MTMDLELTGKKAVVTGGSRGIGRSVVLALARQGVSVCSVYRQESEAVNSLAAELEDLRNGSFMLQADVSSEEAIKRLATIVRERFGQVDVLVNNAGVVSHMTLETMTLLEWERVIHTNLTSLYMVTQALLDLFPSGGSIINVTSAVAMRGMVGRTHYTASKAGIIGFTRSLCKELGPKNIRVNAIAPGIIETDQTSGLTSEGRARYGNLTALARLGEPDEIAGAALFFASGLSSYVSGVTLNVDGGI